jgi:hypothetical protein
LCRGVYNDGANLLIGKEFDGSVRKDSKQGCGMPAEESSCAVFAVDVFHRGDDPKPAAGVFCELGIRGLEEDFDAVEGGDHCFGLFHIPSAHAQDIGMKREMYSTPCQSSSKPSPPYVVEALLVRLLRLRCYRVVVCGADSQLLLPRLVHLSWFVGEQRGRGGIFQEGRGHSLPPRGFGVYYLLAGVGIVIPP